MWLVVAFEMITVMNAKQVCDVISWNFEYTIRLCTDTNASTLKHIEIHGCELSIVALKSPMIPQNGIPPCSSLYVREVNKMEHDDVMKWKHFPRYWPFVQGIHRWPVNPPHKGQWCGALMSSLICPWINGWVNKCVAGDLRCHHAHYDVTIMS